MTLKANELIPVELVFSPQWWNKEAGITFDRDFFFHPARRVEDERKMEKILYEKWGGFGLGRDRNTDRPEQGAVHLASGYLLSEMMGCKVEYNEAAPPQVVCRYMDEMDARPAEDAFKSDSFKSFNTMRETLKTKYGYVSGDVNWSGILNLAIDLRGPEIFEDLTEDHEKSVVFFNSIAAVIEKFTGGLQESANSTSVSVNRNVIHLDKPVLLHSECSLTMVSEAVYREYIMPHDLKWSQKDAPFGIHYCGADPHRFAKAFGEIPNLSFLDVGYGGDVAMIRKYLPKTFLNIRLSPVELTRCTPNDVRETVLHLVKQSADYELTGVCCINMDDTVKDENVDAIFEAREELLNFYREKYESN